MERKHFLSVADRKFKLSLQKGCFPEDKYDIHTQKILSQTQVPSLLSQSQVTVYTNLPETLSAYTHTHRYMHRQEYQSE